MQRALVLLLGLVFVVVEASAAPERSWTVIQSYPPTGAPDIDGTSRITKLLKTMQSFSTPPVTDVLAQQAASWLTGSLGERVDIERHPQGNTIAAAQLVAHAKPDGRTLLFAGSPTITIYPAAGAGGNFDPPARLAPVALLAHMPIALVASANTSMNSVNQLIVRARQTPGRVNYAALGDRSLAYLTGKLFSDASAAGMVAINYNGSGAAINAVTVRHVEFGFVPLTAALPYVRSGTVRLLAVTSHSRHEAVPGTPTVAESGIKNFEAAGWFGLFTTSGTPHDAVALLNTAINRALSEGFIQRALAARGLTTEALTPAQFSLLISRDTSRWQQAVHAAIKT